MREGRTNGGLDGEGGAAAAWGGVLRRRRQPAAQPSTSGSAASSSNPSTSGSAASSSSGRRVEEEEGGGGGGGSKKQGRRRNQRPREGVARAILERLPAAAACWGSGAVVVEGIGGTRGRSRRERPRDGGGGEDGPGAVAAAAARAPAAAWYCVCPDEECRLEANPSANGKEDPGLRSLLEHNDFFSDDCILHAAAFSEPGDSSG